MAIDDAIELGRYASGRRTARPARPRRGAVVWTLPALLALAVEADPDRVALRAGARSISYRELDVDSSRLARLLIDRGVGPEDRIAIGIPRSIESVTAVWAIAKSGAAFVPIDPRYPADRVAHLLADSGAMLGLSIRASVDRLPGPDWLVLDDPEVAALLAGYADDPVTRLDRRRPLYAAHPAYLIYTSGSTGLPKGVVVSHAGLANFAAEQRDRYRITARSRTLHFASPSFDAAVLELLLAVSAAATMVIAPPDLYGGAELAELLRDERVTHAFITPAALASVDPDGLDELAVVVVGGEACPPELVRRWAVPIPAGRRRFHNGYGPTETTIMTNISEPLVPGESITIGPAIRGMSARVLDGRLDSATVGDAGELYLAGPGLARGYHGQPVVTATRFVADPFGPPGARMYRSGDITRTTVGGALEYLGRNDFQVKIRGFRIELGEIDAALAAHPAVDYAVTVGRETPSGATMLVGYVVFSPGAQADPTELRDFVAIGLPEYMVPAIVVPLERIPLTPVGKLDRAALPAPPLPTRPYRAPETDTETVVATALAEVLGLPRIGRDDDFFALGGNSLLVVRAAARIGAELGVRIPPRIFFGADTVAALARAVASAESERRPLLMRRDRPDPMPLSAAQQRLWLTNRFDSTTPLYNIPFALRLTGDLDVTALREALLDVVDRHEPLRTIYPEHDGAPVQRVLSAALAAPAPEPQPISAAELPARLLAGAARGFDLRGDAPVRAELFRLAADQHVLAVVAHHIACDGTSLAPLARDVVIAYQARIAATPPGWAPLAVDYADYVLWQRDLLGDESVDQSLAAVQARYWRQQLSGAPELLDLPTDRPRPAVPSGRGDTVEFRLDAVTVETLRRIADAHDASLFMVLHAGLAVLLSRLSGSADITVGTQISGRGERLLDDLIGMFGNTLVLRTEVDAAQTFSQFLAAVRETDLAAYEHAELGVDRVVELVRPGHALAYAPLFQVLLMLQNFEAPRLDLPGLRLEQVDPDFTVAKLDLAVTLTEQPGGAVHGAIDYATDLFERASVTALADRLVAILTTVGRDGHVPIGDISLLSPRERAALASWSGPRSEPGTVLEAFAAQAIRNPDAPAILFGDRISSYGEFAARVYRLARRLIAAGVGPETVVAVAIRRSPEALLAVYATLAAGGVYVPIDPDHPAERIGHILRTARPLGILVAGSEPDRIQPEDLSIPYWRVDEGAADLPATVVTDVDRRAPLRPENAAYILFTSGSTGRPKGVVVTHRAVVNQLGWMREQYDIGPADALLHKTPMTFDASLWELFLALQIGARLVIARHDGHLDPGYLIALAREHRVAMLEFVPSLLAMVADTAGELPAELRYLSVGGEELPPDLVARLRERHPAVIDNTYGPTETTVTATVFRCAGPTGERVPIGRPVSNTGAHVLDSRLHPVPPGVPGELYLTGVQLARGYRAASGQTAGRFVADPAGGPGTRMYRTGDRVRYRSDGSLEFLGRTDFQVKLRGLRIELGEIETALTAHPAVARAVAVVARHEPVGDFLAAYVVAATTEPVPVDQVIAHIAARLPAYMVPQQVIPLDSLPLTPSGKLDRRALPAVAAPAAPDYREPRTPAERIVAATFAELLGVSRIGLDDNFFGLGGNSLVGMRLVTRLSAALDTELGVRELFEAPTVAELAARSGRGARPARPVLGPRSRPARIPLSFAQQRMWFLNRLAPDSPSYNIPLAVRLTGPLDVAALRAALRDVLWRHEALRTRYPSDSQGPWQQIEPVSEVPLTLDPEPVAARLTVARVAEIVGAGFDVAEAVPLRVALLREAAEVHVLVVVVHHINADGFSMGPLARDLTVAYADRAAHRVPGWSALPVQYADYTLWQRDSLGSAEDPDSLGARQLAYWARTLDGIPDRLELPADRPRPPVATLRGGTHRAPIPVELHAGLTALAAHQGTTLFAVLHAAFAVLLARLSGTGDIVVGTPVAGRGAAELDDVVGVFVNTVVLRTGVDPDAGFLDHLAAVTAADPVALDHADLPFERLVEVLDPPRSQARTPLFQVLLSVQNNESPRLTLGELSMSLLLSEIAVAPFDLTLNLAARPGDGDTPGELIAEWNYATDLFDAGTVIGFAERFERLLAAVLTDPARPVGAIELMTPAERATVLVPADTEIGNSPVAGHRTLADAVAAQVARTPDAVALTGDGPELTYAEFAARVNRLARYLVAAGAGPEVPVAVCIPRSVDAVVAAHAVVAAGAVYLPLDPEHPSQRHRTVLDAARPRLVLVAAESPVAENGPSHSVAAETTSGTTGFAFDTAEFGTAVLRIDDPRVAAFAADPLTDADRRAALRPENAAYILFTSGSTGRPKGVVITHRAISAQLDWVRTYFGISAADAVLHKTPVSFDVSIPELFGPPTAGARMVVAAPGAHRDPEHLLALAHRHDVRIFDFVPSMASALLDAGGPLPAALREFCLGGEEFPPDLLARLRERTDAAIANVYGPTEVTVTATAYRRADPVGERVPIGRPIPGTGVAVLDPRLRAVPPGVVGELYLTGVQLARGYLTRPAQTAERFVADPFADNGTRMYRTGDLVRWNRDGELEFLGRVDAQVKVRGLRIEPGEIEAALRELPGVRHAAVLVRTDDRAGDRLVGYLAAPANFPIDVAKAALEQRLPDYMVPAALVVLDELPYNSAGKIDRAALPEPQFAPRPHRPAITAAERLVAAVLSEVLGVSGIGRDDNFFDLGGNSLLATRVTTLLAERTGHPARVQWLFATPTVAGLAGTLDTASGAGDTTGLEVVLPIRSTGTGPPLFCLPPMIGLSWSYGTLAAQLPDRPIYGLQTPVLTEPETSSGTVTDLADRYITAIRSIQPHGPYHLLGWSRGGVVAHAVATRLQGAGEPVAAPILLDSTRHTDPDRFRAELTAALGEFGVVPDPDQDLGTLSEVQLATLAAAIPDEFFALGPERVRRLYAAAVAPIESGYRPDVFDGDIIYLTPTAEPQPDGGGPAEWEPFATGSVLVHPISATHAGMLAPEPAAEIAEVVRAEQARTRDSACS